MKSVFPVLRSYYDQDPVGTAKIVNTGKEAATGVISGTNISVTVPNGTSVTALVASFTTTGASVTVGGIAQEQDSISGTSISVTVPYGTSLTNLVAAFSYSGSSILIGSVPQIKGRRLGLCNSHLFVPELSLIGCGSRKGNLFESRPWQACPLRVKSKDAKRY
jgi:hypothetical protein